MYYSDIICYFIFLVIHHHHHHHHNKKEVLESFDFNDNESLMWRKVNYITIIFLRDIINNYQHQFRRYFQSKGKFWTSSRITTAWKWSLVILTGLIIACTGALVAVLTEAMTSWKFESCYKLQEEGNMAGAFFAYQFFCLFFALIAGAMCWREPAGT